jgi:Delta7-sterol 5-desaturase
MICYLASSDLSFLPLWGLLSLLSLLTLSLCSTALFYSLYLTPTYSLWKYKINPKFPSIQKIKEEILVMLQGILFSTICPALSIYLTRIDHGYGYCEIQQHGFLWLTISFFLVWFGSDFYEFLYHYLGHYYPFMWRLHKGHHSFSNPTPFAVIADNPIDQFFRAAPILFFPLLFPVHLEMIFFMYSILFYINGLIQHSGYDIPYIDSHSTLILTSYHHYLHHAKSIIHKPLYNGQLFQIWDQLFDSVDTSPRSQCLCSRCARERGERTYEQWLAIEKPNYFPLFTLNFWLSNLLKMKKEN